MIGMTPSREGRRGFVLVSVLWILAILSVVSLGFARRAMIERRVAWYELDRAQALHMARGAVIRGMFEIRNRRIINIYERNEEGTGLHQRWARPGDLFGEGLYGVERGGQEQEGAGEPDRCEYRIYDCLSRLSINHAPEAMLTELDGLDFNVIRKLMARRSTDGGGAIRYLVIDEIRDLGRIDDEDWYGEGDEPGLRDLLTVWGIPGGLVNINTAPAAILRTIPGLDETVIDAILEYRAGNDGSLGTEDDQAFAAIHEVTTKLDVDPEDVQGIDQYCTVISDIFTIEAVATRRQGRVVAYCSATVGSGALFPTILQWREDTLGS